MLRKRSPLKTPDTTDEPNNSRNRNPKYSLCLSTSRSPTAEIDRELQVAGEAGFSCVELWAPALEAYLARYPVVWLDMQLRQHGIRALVLDGLAPLAAEHTEDTLVNQARFLEQCTHLDSLGGGTIVLRPAAGQEENQSRSEANARALRIYADLAAPFEVILAFEFQANSMVPGLSAAHDLVQRVARSNLRLALSVREWAAQGSDPQELEAFDPSQLALVHLDRPLDQQPTESESDSAQDPCARLAAAGFRGPYCISLPSGPGTLLDRARAARETAALQLQARP